MKTKISICSVVLSIVMMLSSCAASETEYKIFLHDSSSYYSKPKDVYGLDILYMPYLLETYDRADAPRSLDIEFNGSSYYVEYSDTKVFSSDGGFAEDGYSYKTEDGVFAHFYLDTETGEITSYLYSDKNYLSRKEESNAKKLDRDECFGVVVQFLAKRSVDFSVYELTEESQASGVGTLYHAPYYKFTFSRVINGIRTSDDFKVIVTCYGDIVDYEARSPGHMKNAKELSDEEISLVRKTFDEMMESTFNGKVFEYSYEVKDIEYTRLYDGKYVLVYKVDMIVIETEDGFSLEEHFPTHCSFIIYV